MVDFREFLSKSRVVKNPGIRGGTFYINSRGNVVYGSPPRGQPRRRTGATTGIHFRGMTHEDANKLRARLAHVAHEQGYHSPGGRNSGQGSVADLLVAIANGDVTLAKRGQGKEHEQG